MAARTGAAGLGGGSVWPSGQPEIIVVMFDLISEGLAKHLVMPMGGHNVGVKDTSAKTPQHKLSRGHLQQVRHVRALRPRAT